MSKTTVIGLVVLVAIALISAASFAIFSTSRGEHENETSGTQRSATGGRAASEHASSGTTAGERQTSETSVEVLISGDPGVRFSGEIKTPDGVRSIEGTVPEVYPLATSDSAPRPEWVTVSVHKEAQTGTLTAQVLRDGRPVASEETSAESGLVQVTWKPPQ